jgi:hypothetical protein
VQHIDGRESEFLNAAIIEIADAAGLGALYLKKIAEMREVLALIFDLSEIVFTYGSGFASAEKITFPRVGFSSTANAASGSYEIGSGERAHVWQQLVQSLRLDPYHKATIPLPK